MSPTDSLPVYRHHLMDSRYNDPPPIYPHVVKPLLHLRKLVIRHLLPPRPYYLRYLIAAEDPDPKTGRYYAVQYDGEPWYETSIQYLPNILTP